MPVVFTAAIDSGFTPVSIMVDGPTEFLPGPGQDPYSPKNDDGLYLGEVTLRQALEASRNIVAVKLAEAVGIPRVFETARRLGLYGDYAPLISLGAGEFDSTLVDLASVYATIANQGVRVEPHIIVSVTELAGTQLEEPAIAPRAAVNADTAFIITSLLSGVIERGTGAAARSLDWPVAGKTGTVADGTDAWFVGFDPEITVGVWVGHDDMRPIQSEAGASAALSIWTDFMRAYISARGNTGNRPRFDPPVNIDFVKLDSGATEAFIAGTQPGSQPAAPSPP
jgi:penicillin-binding protein 1A